jgi:O-antigen/teichoic acid export membrane protein
MKINSFGKNACFYAAATIGVRAASFLITPIYTYSLTVGDYGLLAVLLQTIQIMVIVMGLGSRTALIRFAKAYEEEGKAGVLFGTSTVINIAGAVAVTALSGTLLLPLFRGVLHRESVLAYVLLTCLGAALNCLSIHLMGYFRAGQQGLKVTLASLGGAVILVALTLTLVRAFKLGVYGVLLAQAGTYGLLTAFLLFLVTNKVRLGFSLTLAWDLVRFGAPLVFVMSGGLITQSTAFYFLSYFNGLDQVGIYNIGLKMAQIVEMILILPCQMAYEPFVYGHIGDSQLWQAISRLLTYMITAFAFTAFAIVFVARDVLPLIAPPAYSAAYSVIFLVIPALAFRAVYYVGESLLFLEKRTAIAGTVVTSFTLLSIVLNYMFIYRWGMYGAAAVLAFTTVCTGATVLKLGLKMAPVTVDRDRLFVAAMLLLSLLVIVYALRSTPNYVYYTVVPAAACTATALLYVSSFIRKDERRVIESFIAGLVRGFTL